MADLLPPTLFYGGVFFACYASISSLLSPVRLSIVLVEERRESSDAAIIPLKGAEETVDDVDMQAVVNEIPAEVWLDVESLKRSALFKKM